MGDRKTGLLFESENGTPLLETNILRRHLHPALHQLGFVNEFTGSHKAGTHAFRRFRNTYLRSRTGCPEAVRDYWLAWSSDSDEGGMSKHYDAIDADDATRLEWAEKCGIGFDLPSVVPHVPQNGAFADVTKAAQVMEYVRERMVGERGFEPPTPWSRTRCSTRLSHSPYRCHRALTLLAISGHLRLFGALL